MRFRLPDRRILACTLIGAAALAVCIAGVFNDRVMAAMKRRKASAAVISALMRDPRNADCVEARRRSATAVQHEYATVRRYVDELNGRKPLIRGVLPDARSDAKRYEFGEAYATAIVGLVKRLQAAGPAGPGEIQAAQREIDEWRAWLAEQDDEDCVQRQFPSRPAAPRTHSDGLIRQATARGDPRLDPVLRAGVERARSILCYAAPRSFHLSPVIRDDRPPSMEEIWYAQVGLWIQQDVVEAVAELNNQVSAARSDTDAHVQHSPVKRIIRIAIDGYRLDGTTIRFPSIDDEPRRAGTAARLVFTPYTGHGDIDVIPFRLTLIVDQRDMLEVIDRISAKNLYRCVNLSYTTPGDERKSGYLYGSEPVVRVQIEFEAYFLRALFEPLMPDDVLRRLGRLGGSGG